MGWQSPAGSLRVAALPALDLARAWHAKGRTRATRSTASGSAAIAARSPARIAIASRDRRSRGRTWTGRPVATGGGGPEPSGHVQISRPALRLLDGISCLVCGGVRVCSGGLPRGVECVFLLCNVFWYRVVNRSSLDGLWRVCNSL